MIVRIMVNEKITVLRRVCLAGAMWKVIIPFSCMVGKNRSLSRNDLRIRKELRKWISSSEYRTDRGLDLIAERADVSRDEASAFFKHYVRSSFTSTRLRLRIHDAKELLIHHPEMSISAIAREVGILDRSSFRKSFTRIVGIRPSEWREINLQV